MCRAPPLSVPLLCIVPGIYSYYVYLYVCICIYDERTNKKGEEQHYHLFTSWTFHIWRFQAKVAPVLKALRWNLTRASQRGWRLQPTLRDRGFTLSVDHTCISGVECCTQRGAKITTPLDSMQSSVKPESYIEYDQVQRIYQVWYIYRYICVNDPNRTHNMNIITLKQTTRKPTRASTGGYQS